MHTCGNEFSRNNQQRDAEGVKFHRIIKS